MSEVPPEAGESRSEAGESRSEACAALAMTRVEGLGPARIRRAIERHGSARVALEALRDGDREAFRRGEPAARGEDEAPPEVRLPGELRARLAALEPAPEAEIESWRARGIRVLPCTAPDYPAALEELHDPPPILFLQGEGELPGLRAITIVGSRRATDYGRRMSRDLATGFVRYGWTVVSGMARGIDAEAHRAALEAGGHTVGVLAGGLEVGGGRLREDVRARGLLMSEIEPSFPPDDWAFPRRNRLLAALGRGVVVVQAGRRSGTSITVSHALDLGREVFAVPGPVGPAVSEGVHQLVRGGAGLITCAEDVLEDLGEILESGGGDPDGDLPEPDGLPPPGRASRAILSRVRSGPADAGELIRLSGLTSSAALALLSRLELAGWLRVTEDGRYRHLPPCHARSGPDRARARPPGWRAGPGGRRTDPEGRRTDPAVTGRDGTEPPILA